MVVGLVIPLIVQSFLLRSIFLLFDQIDKENFWPLFVSTALGDFVSIFFFTTPFLFFATPLMQLKGYTIIDTKISRTWPSILKKVKNPKNAFELGLIALFTILFSQSLEFTDYWYLYGILALYSAIRYGFGISILVNSLILILTYVMPSILEDQFRQEVILSDEMRRIQIGSGLLYVFSLVTGRVISDAVAYQNRIYNQKEELEHINKELDRFVYSVSHDLSAPLKSIRGLVNISRVEEMNGRLKEYIDHIEISTNKLEGFISEILDFSRNDRVPVKSELIDIRLLCQDILDGLRFFDNYSKIKIDLDSLDGQKIYSDKLRLKIILTNLLSNAIKYQDPEKDGYVMIDFDKTNEDYIIRVKDNGEGIHPEFQKKIFDMFYRGTVSSHGSGLGLYITKEVIDRLGGTISVESKSGVGSIFEVSIPVDE